MWRPAILSRWESKADRQMYMRLFARELLGGVWARNARTTWIAGQLICRHQRQKFPHGDGVTRASRDHVWSVYTKTLDRLQATFERQPYLLGDKPCMAEASASMCLQPSQQLKLANNKNIKRYNVGIDTIDKLCSFFSCSFGDVAEYVREDEAA